MQEGGFVGPGVVPVRFSADDHSGYGGGQMTKVESGTQEYFGPIYVTDDGDSPVEEYDGERPEPPENGVPTEE